MAKNFLTKDEARQTAEMYIQVGRNICQLAREMNIPRTTAQHRLRNSEVVKLISEIEKPFIVPELPSGETSIDELRARMRAISERKIAADDARALIPVKITIPGPIGLFCMGDPHLGNDGCDWARLEDDIAAVENHPRIMSVNIGDVTDNWVGRLEREYANSSVTAADSWRLAEWLFDRPVNWLTLVGGNHDAWSGHRDPLKWITKARVPLYEPSAARLGLQHPNGEITRIHARHDFPGKSMYSDLHGHRRQIRDGKRDHLLVAGHLHSGEDGAIINGDGFVSQMVRLSGYKRVDRYAKDLGFQPKHMHPSALVIINPDVPETERSRVWVAPSIRDGVEWLNMIAAKAA